MDGDHSNYSQTIIAVFVVIAIRNLFLLQHVAVPLGRLIVLLELRLLLSWSLLETLLVLFGLLAPLLLLFLGNFMRKINAILLHFLLIYFALLFAMANIRLLLLS
jgi:hypothetical protein